jgi:hypothetical protein
MSDASSAIFGSWKFGSAAVKIIGVRISPEKLTIAIKFTSFGSVRSRNAGFTQQSCLRTTFLFLPFSGREQNQVLSIFTSCLGIRICENVFLTSEKHLNTSVSQYLSPFDLAPRVFDTVDCEDGKFSMPGLEASPPRSSTWPAREDTLILEILCKSSNFSGCWTFFSALAIPNPMQNSRLFIAYKRVVRTRKSGMRRISGLIVIELPLASADRIIEGRLRRFKQEINRCPDHPVFFFAEKCDLSDEIIDPPEFSRLDPII